MAAQTNGAVRSKRCKKVSESTRERETFRYYSALRNAGVVNQSGNSPASSTLTSCGDAILTALAQAGVSQTGTDRALISLFDADNQYIVAEATATTPLRASLQSTDSDPLWLCGSAIPRSHGVCEYSLLGGRPDDPEILVGEEPSDRLPLTLSKDLVADPCFNSKPYCQPGALCRFYAAVPIRTRRGINIGVYCVISETPNRAWCDGYTERLRDISENIMDHLESKRLEALYRRNIRMNRGLASFIEGEGTLLGVQNADCAPALVDDHMLEGTLNAEQQELLQQDGTCGIESAVASPVHESTDPLQSIPPKADETSTSKTPARDSRKPSVDNSSTTDDNNPASVLSKAANLLREAMEVEGCVFADATMEGYRAPAPTNPVSNTLEQPLTSSSDDNPNQSSSGQPLRPCSILAFSTTVKSSINGDSSGMFSTALPEKFLAKLLRRYPNGKIFNFGADGALQTSDSSDDDSAKTSLDIGRPSSRDNADDALSGSVHGRLPPKPWARQREGTILARAFPGARCVAFTPVWDPRRDRWYAGSFVYSNAPERHFSELDELNYLRAFSILTMAEILRTIDLQADKAKSDVLGSLSHELRSPLHGVILSAELLGETKLSVFQGNAAHTIEICSRTLLDTIDHLLDYSKINNFSRKKTNGKPKPTRHRGTSQAVAALDDDAQNGAKNLACVSQLDHLIEEVIESVFAGYTFQFLSVTQAKDAQPAATSAANRRQSMSMRTVTDFDPAPTETVKISQEFGDLSVILSIDPRQNWSYFVQVGAIRRIVMNIFGNALKYTTSGTIRVSLTQEVVALQRHKKERVVKFRVEDTGKGMGEDFLKHGLFRPFSQEDTLSPGTGLGLSLVKRIVTELRGQVSIQSQVNVGTTVSVVLPLEQVSKSPERPLAGHDANQTFTDQVQDLKGLRVGLALSKQSQDGGTSEWEDAVRDICNDWLTMEIVSTKARANAPDLILWSHDALPTSSKDLKALARTPNVVLCPNALVAYNHSSAFDAADHAAIFEFISQPIGPRKLARALLLAYTRWMNVVDSPISSPTTPSTMRKLESTPRAKAQSSDPRVSRPPLDRGPSSSPSRGTPTDDESVFSDSKGRTMGGLATTDDTPNSEAPDPFTKFLLVDDNHINLKVLSTYMKKLGIEYDTAMNGKEAVDLFCKPEQVYSCVLMDISMPIMDGFEATRCIRAHEDQESLRRVPIIALSGLASEDAQKEAIGSGMDVLLTKPVKLKTLGNLLESRSIIEVNDRS